ncbi:MAG: hypothetical protein K9G62_05230 [Alphaproteobacteria bacterium]|nr:hypothetical protein [Alphaproteobacteria bacterium]
MTNKSEPPKQIKPVPDWLVNEFEENSGESLHADCIRKELADDPVALQEFEDGLNILAFDELQEAGGNSVKAGENWNKHCREAEMKFENILKLKNNEL